MPSPLTLTPLTPGSLTLTAKTAGSSDVLMPHTGLFPSVGLDPSDQGLSAESVASLTLTPRS